MGERRDGPRLPRGLRQHVAQLRLRVAEVGLTGPRVLEQEPAPPLASLESPLGVRGLLRDVVVARRLQHRARVGGTAGAVVGVAELLPYLAQVVVVLRARGIRAVHGLEERHGVARAAGRGEALGVDLPEPLVAGVRLPVRRDHPQRLLEERERTLAASAHVEEARVIPPRQPEHRIPLTDGPPDLRLRLLVRGLGALVEAETLLLAGQVEPELADARLIRDGRRLVDRDGALQDFPRSHGLSALGERDRDQVERVRELAALRRDLLVDRHGTVECADAFLSETGCAAEGARLHGPPRGAQDSTLRRRLLQRGVGLGEDRGRLGVVLLRACGVGVGEEGFDDDGVPRPVSRASQLRPPLLHRLVALFLAEVRVDVRRQPEELDLEVRLGPELLLDAGRTDVEELFRRDLPARLVLRDARVARAEDSEEEVFRGVRARGLARRAARLPRRAGDAGEEREEHGRRGGEREPPPSQESPQHVRASARSRLHRLAAPVTSEVVGECARVGVARARLHAERLPDDRVEVAAQPLRRHGAGLSSGLARRRRRGVHQLLHGGREGHLAHLPRRPPREELVEHDAEGVDVRGRRDRAAGELLGRRVRGGEVECVRRLAVSGGLEDLRDAEVEELHAPVAGDEDVRGLQVAVDDEVRVRERDRVADLAEQLEPPLERRLVRITERAHVLALDVLHRHVRPAVGRDAAVGEPRDAGMLEARKDLALGLEASGRYARERARELQRDSLPEPALDALREVDVAHPARAEPAHETVRSDRRAERFCGRSVGVLRGERRPLEEALALVAQSEEPNQALVERGVGSRVPREERIALGWRHGQRGIEEPFYFAVGRLVGHQGLPATV